MGDWGTTQARYRGEDCSTSRRAIQIYAEGILCCHSIYTYALLFCAEEVIGEFNNFPIWAIALLYGAEGRLRSTHKGSCVPAEGILCCHSIYTYALLFCVEEVIGEFNNFPIWVIALLYGAEGRFRATHKGSCVPAEGILCCHSIYTYALLFCAEEVIVRI